MQRGQGDNPMTKHWPLISDHYLFLIATDHPARISILVRGSIVGNKINERSANVVQHYQSNKTLLWYFNAIGDNPVRRDVREKKTDIKAEKCRQLSLRLGLSTVPFPSDLIVRFCSTSCCSTTCSSVVFYLSCCCCCIPIVPLFQNAFCLEYSYLIMYIFKLGNHDNITLEADTSER